MNKLTFIGTPNFGEAVLESIIKEGISPSLVITSPDKKAGRGQKLSPSPVKETALKNGIFVKEAESKKSLYKILKEERPDVVLVAAFGMIMEKEVLDIPQKGFLNIHPSLLPKYRGPSPIQSAIINGEKESGVAIIKLDEKMDHGPIISSSKVPLKENITYPEAEKLLAYEGAKIFSSTLPLFMEGKIKGTPQDHKSATYTSKITKEDGRVDWKEPAQKIERRVRAFHPWPGCFTFCDVGRIKILEAGIQEQTGDGPFGDPGKVYLATNDNIAVQTGENFLIIKKIQAENGRPLSVKDFLQGNISIIGKMLE